MTVFGKSNKERAPKRVPRLTRAGALAAGLMATSLLAAACDVSTSSSAAAERSQALAYSQCMRSHGITDFPDQNSQGGMGTVEPASQEPLSDLNESNPQYQAADHACESPQPDSNFDLAHVIGLADRSEAVSTPTVAHSSRQSRPTP